MLGLSDVPVRLVEALPPSRALDAICALAVEARCGDAAFVTVVSEQQHNVCGRFGTEARMFRMRLAASGPVGEVIVQGELRSGPLAEHPLVNGTTDRFASVMQVCLHEAGVFFTVASRDVLRQFTEEEKRSLQHLARLVSAQLSSAATLVWVAEITFNQIEALQG